MGHWDLFVDPATLAHPALFGTGDDARVVLRSSPAGAVAVLKKLLADAEGERLLRQLQARADQPDEARAVNRYAAALSMPAALLRDAARAVDRTHWRKPVSARRAFRRPDHGPARPAGAARPAVRGGGQSAVRVARPGQRTGDVAF